MFLGCRWKRSTSMQENLHKPRENIQTPCKCFFRLDLNLRQQCKSVIHEDQLCSQHVIQTQSQVHVKGKDISTTTHSYKFLWSRITCTLSTQARNVEWLEPFKVDTFLQIYHRYNCVASKKWPKGLKVQELPDTQASSDDCKNHQAFEGKTSGTCISH